MLYEVTGDLVKDKQYDIFCHQTNCKGRMGAGIARQIAETYPIVRARDAKYHEVCVNYRGGEHAMLGTIMGSRTDDGRLCINMYAQEDYARANARRTMSRLRDVSRFCVTTCVTIRSASRLHSRIISDAVSPEANGGLLKI